MGLAAFLVGVGVLIALATMRSQPVPEVIDGCVVRRTRTSLTIQPPRPFPPGLSIRPVLSGFAVDGEERWLAAMLDTEMWSAIEAIGSRVLFSIDDGVVRIGSRVGGVRALEEVLHPAIEIAKRLSEEIDVQRRIAHNAKNDALARRRKHCLEILIRDRAPMSKQIASELLEDESPELRLIAARHVGAKAVSVFWSLASDASVPEAVRASAIGEWVRYEMFDEVRRGLRRLLDEAQPPRVLAAIAKGIGAIGGDFEPDLIRLVRIGDATVQMAAIEALARIGTIACVEGLLAVAKRSDTPEEIRNLARRTVTTIQNGARGEGGRLSLVEAEGGELSMEDGGSERR